MVLLRARGWIANGWDEDEEHQKKKRLRIVCIIFIICYETKPTKNKAPAAVNFCRFLSYDIKVTTINKCMRLVGFFRLLSLLLELNITPRLGRLNEGGGRPRKTAKPGVGTLPQNGLG